MEVKKKQSDVRSNHGRTFSNGAYRDSRGQLLSQAHSGKTCRISSGLFISAAAFLLYCACAAHAIHEQASVLNSIETKLAESLPLPADSILPHLHEKISLGNGLSEEDAVAIALYNNAQFQADLAQLGFAKADLVEAGMIRNPILSFLFPLGPKQLEATLDLPADILWQRPQRVANARLNSEQLAENLIQHGLGLVKNTLSAYAELFFLENQARISSEEADLQTEILEIAESRLSVGDISELEAIPIRLEETRLKENSEKMHMQAENQRIHLRTLLGLVQDSTEVRLHPDSLLYDKSYTIEELLKIAFAARPDLRAAEIEIEASGKRLGWENSKIVNLTAVLDANGSGKEGFEMGPGVKAELPLFNWNQGGRTRAAAQMDHAAKKYLAKLQQISFEVHQAHQNYITAQRILILAQTEIIPEAIRIAANAEGAFEVGEISYPELLEFRRKLLYAHLKESEATANFRKAEAELFYSAGFRLL